MNKDLKKKKEDIRQVDKMFQDAVVEIAQDPNTEKMIPDIKNGEVVGFYIKHKS